jgi:AGZA family xanthine/uracil permease-like MFS transporter
MFLSSTLYSMAKFAGLRDPVTFDFEGSTIAYCVDAFSISMGALLGSSPVTAYIESATGISGTPIFFTCTLEIIANHA